MKEYAFAAKFSSMLGAVNALCKVSKSFNDMLDHASAIRDEASTEVLRDCEDGLPNVPISLNDILGQKTFQDTCYNRKVMFMFYEYIKKYNEFSNVNNDITITEEDDCISLTYTTFSQKNTYIFNMYSLYESNFNDISIETIWKCRSKRGTCLKSIEQSSFALTGKVLAIFVSGTVRHRAKGTIVTKGK